MRAFTLGSSCPRDASGAKRTRSRAAAIFRFDMFEWFLRKGAGSSSSAADRIKCATGSGSVARAGGSPRRRRSRARSRRPTGACARRCRRCCRECTACRRRVRPDVAIGFCRERTVHKSRSWPGALYGTRRPRAAVLLRLVLRVAAVPARDDQRVLSPPLRARPRQSGSPGWRQYIVQSGS